MKITKLPMLWAVGLLLIAAVGVSLPLWSDEKAPIRGQVREAGGAQAPLAGARVTVFNEDFTTFRETRTDADGQYRAELPRGTYWVGASAVQGPISYGYQQVVVAVTKDGATADFFLDVDRNVGQWSVVGSTAPEDLAGTGSGILLPDGTIFYCHDAMEPLLFDPIFHLTRKAPASSSVQGCHGPGLLADGLALIVGGGRSPTEAVATVKGFSSSGWDENFFPLRLRRWYPGLALLPDGRYLALGGNTGGTLTASCELFDPATRRWSDAAPLSGAVDYPPAILLSTGPHRGKVLVTHPRPQLFNPDLGTWEPTGGFVQPNRRAPNHADHTLTAAIDALLFAVQETISIACRSMTLATSHGNLQFCGFDTPSIANCDSDAAPSHCHKRRALTISTSCPVRVLRCPAKTPAEYVRTITYGIPSNFSVGCDATESFRTYSTSSILIVSGFTSCLLSAASGLGSICLCLYI